MAIAGAMKNSLVFWGREGGFFGHFLRKFIGTAGISCGVWCFFWGSLKQTREVVKDIAEVHEH